VAIVDYVRVRTVLALPCRRVLRAVAELAVVVACTGLLPRDTTFACGSAKVDSCAKLARYARFLGGASSTARAGLAESAVGIRLSPCRACPARGLLLIFDLTGWTLACSSVANQVGPAARAVGERAEASGASGVRALIGSVARALRARTGHNCLLDLKIVAAEPTLLVVDVARSARGSEALVQFPADALRARVVDYAGHVAEGSAILT
jgi:hypothetical protein